MASDTLDGTLVHRPDLRRTMLKLLVEKMPERARQIHQAAVKWYALESGWRAKAEELYHRLSLQELPDDPALEHPDVHSSLQYSISELPPNAQRFLATHGYEIDPAVLSQATQEEQELALVAEIEELLPYGPRSVSYAQTLLDAGAALDHAGPLFCSAARIKAQQGYFKEAAELIGAGLDWAFKAMHSREALALLSEQAWLRRRNPELGDVESTLPILEEYARRHDSLTIMLQHRIQKYELLTGNNSFLDDRGMLLRETSGLIGRLTPNELWSIFPLLENVIQILGEDSQINLFRLVHIDEDLFARVQFVSRDAQYVLQRLIKTTNPRDMSSFVDAVKELCKSWPYQILRVKPPYSSASYGSESSAR